MNVRRAAALAFLLLPATFACEDDIGFGDDRLTPEESRTLALITASLAIESSPYGQLFQGSPYAAPADDVGVRFSSECPEGGEVETELGDVDGVLPGNEEFEIGLELILTPKRCRIRDPESDDVYTLDGAPNVTLDLKVRVSPDEGASADGTATGAINWELGDRRGTCGIDLVLEGAAGEGGAVSVSVTGTVCGNPVDAASAD